MSKNPSQLDQSHEIAFQTGIKSFGVLFLDKLRSSLLDHSKYSFSHEERDAIDVTISRLKSFCMNKLENMRALKLFDCLSFGLGKHRNLLLQFGIESQSLTSRFTTTSNKRSSKSPQPHYVMDDQGNRRISLANTVMTEDDGDKEDEDDYEDEIFEEEIFEEDNESNVIDEEPGLILGRTVTTKHGVYDNRRKSSPIQEEIEEYEDEDDDSGYTRHKQHERYTNNKEQLDKYMDSCVDEYIDDYRSEDSTIRTAVPFRSISILESNLIKQRNDYRRDRSIDTSIEGPLQVINSPDFSQHERNQGIDRDKDKQVTPKVSSKEPNLAGSSSSNRLNNVSSSQRSSVRKRSKASVTWIKERQWVLGDRIGAGSFGTVFQGMSKESGQLFACKTLQIGSKQSEVDKLAEEIDLMRGLTHENVVAYLGTLVDEEKGMVYIFQEWVPGGSITQLLKKFGSFSETVVRKYTRQILRGLQYLHDNTIVHRDIKGGNILVDDYGVVKLADFGTSKKIDADEGTEATTSIHGTVFFMPLEMLAENRYGRRGDIWAVGCTMYQMLTGTPPWQEYKLKTIVQVYSHLSRWTQGPPSLPAKINVSSDCYECLKLCFEKKEENRPFAYQLLTCNFLRDEEKDTDDEYSPNKPITSLVAPEPSSRYTDRYIGRSADSDYKDSSSLDLNDNFNDEDSFRSEEKDVLEDSMRDIRERLGRASRVSLGVDSIMSNFPSKNQPEEKLLDPRVLNGERASAGFENTMDKVENEILQRRLQKLAVNPYGSGKSRISRDIVKKAEDAVSGGLSPGLESDMGLKDSDVVRGSGLGLGGSASTSSLPTVNNATANGYEGRSTVGSSRTSNKLYTVEERESVEDESSESVQRNRQTGGSEEEELHVMAPTVETGYRYRTVVSASNPVRDSQKHHTHSGQYSTAYSSNKPINSSSSNITSNNINNNVGLNNRIGQSTNKPYQLSSSRDSEVLTPLSDNEDDPIHRVGDYKIYTSAPVILKTQRTHDSSHHDHNDDSTLGGSIKRPGKQSYAVESSFSTPPSGMGSRMQSTPTLTSSNISSKPVPSSSSAKSTPQSLSTLSKLKPSPSENQIRSTHVEPTSSQPTSNTWKCANTRCLQINSNPDYLNECFYCGIKRGATGDRRVDAIVPRV